MKTEHRIWKCPECGWYGPLQLTERNRTDEALISFPVTCPVCYTDMELCQIVPIKEEGK